jgi:hypothetical protein
MEILFPGFGKTNAEQWITEKFGNRHRFYDSSGFEKRLAYSEQFFSGDGVFQQGFKGKIAGTVRPPPALRV